MILALIFLAVAPLHGEMRSIEDYKYEVTWKYPTFTKRYTISCSTDGLQGEVKLLQGNHRSRLIWKDERATWSLPENEPQKRSIQSLQLPETFVDAHHFVDVLWWWATGMYMILESQPNLSRSLWTQLAVRQQGEGHVRLKSGGSFLIRCLFDAPSDTGPVYKYIYCEHSTDRSSETIEVTLLSRHHRMGRLGLTHYPRVGNSLSLRPRRKR